jgi:CRP-like cAMP-binding protein
MPTGPYAVDPTGEWRSARNCVDGAATSVLDGKNKLLAHLPPEVFARLAPHIQSVHLERQEVLFRAQEPLTTVYFPDTAVVSLVSRLESGQSLEVGLVGRNGIVGTALLPGDTTMTCDGIVLVPGLARRIGADVLRRELLANESLYVAVGRFVQVLLVRSMQMSVCGAFHELERRCIRWLLTVDDLNGEIPLTHDGLATMLGVRRPTVTSSSAPSSDLVSFASVGGASRLQIALASRPPAASAIE